MMRGKDGIKWYKFVGDILKVVIHGFTHALY